jgi:pimeloyl-ACP methyl ester carboxylesterase
MFEFCSKDYDFPVLKKIKIPTKIIVGSKDEYFYPSNPKHPEGAMGILLKNITNSTGKIIDGAIHSFKPHEDVMVREVGEFT